MHTAVVITVSDRSAAGEREDRSGPIAVAALTAASFSCAPAVVVPDGADSVERALREAIAAGARLVVTTGGTGVAPRDQTPEGTARVVERLLPGIAEQLRRDGLADTPAAVLSRGIAGTAGDALIVNLPGSTGAVTGGMRVVCGIAGHVLDQLQGGDH